MNTTGQKCLGHSCDSFKQLHMALIKSTPNARQMATVFAKNHAPEVNTFCLVLFSFREVEMSKGMPSMTALLGLLAVAGYQNRDKISEMIKSATSSAPSVTGTQSAPLGGLLGNLSGMLGGAGAGGLLSGGLGELLANFKQNGHGDIAQSWVTNGPNQPISPQDLRQAIGPDVLATLEQQTGLSQQDVLARLSRELPEAVDKYTPEGQLPNR